jgi:geranylgeranyl reductase family protein
MSNKRPAGGKHYPGLLSPDFLRYFCHEPDFPGRKPVRQRIRNSMAAPGVSSAVEYSEEPFQMPAADLPAGCWDVAIVGAGPAGTASAIDLAKRGYRVLFADLGDFPREKVCGDALTFNAFQQLKEFGLADAAEEAGCRSRSLSVFSPSGIEVRLPGDYLTVRRSVLDALLARKAVASGAVFARGKVTDVAVDEEEGVTVFFEDGPAQRAGCCLLATGSRIGLAQRVGLVSRVPPSGVALRCYVRSSLPLDHLVVAYDRQLLPGYGWIFPVGGQVYNLGCGLFLGRRRSDGQYLGRIMQAFIEGFPLARNLLAEGEMISPLRGAVLRSGLDAGHRPVTDRMLAIGEAIGTTAPCTGEGIGQAMVSGVLAARLVDEAFSTGEFGALRRYADLLDRHIGRHHAGCRAAQTWLARPWRADLIARRAVKSGILRERIKAVVQGAEDPGRIISWRGVFRSLWG